MTMVKPIKEVYTNLLHNELQGGTANSDNCITTEMSLMPPEKTQSEVKEQTLQPRDSTTSSSPLPHPLSKLIDRKGRMIMLLYRSDESPVICIGPQWPIPICVTSFILIVSFLYFYCLWTLLHFYVKAIGVLLCSIQLSAYLCTVLINPGLPSREMWLENFDPDKLNTANYRICAQCQLVMNLNKKTEHCHDCNVCVEGMDHHCPWTSKCIGKRNLLSFYAFIGSTYLYIIYLAFGAFSIVLFKVK